VARPNQNFGNDLPTCFTVEAIRPLPSVEKALGPTSVGLLLVGIKCKTWPILVLRLENKSTVTLTGRFCQK
jgi:hypothetical protein